MEVMTLKEACERYFHGNVSYGKLLAMAKRGEIPVMKMGGRFFTRWDLLDEWFAELAKPNLDKKPKGYGTLRVVAE